MRDLEAFVAFLEDRETWVFGYGPEPMTHDCARFFAAGIKAATGVDPLKAFPSRWTSFRGSRRVLRRFGGMAGAVDVVMRPIEPTMAQRGDGGMLADGELVLVEGDTVVGPAPERGLYRLPRSAAVKAWTI